MDYLQQPALFKIKKVSRYVLLYGVRRTYMKAISQLHLKRRYDRLPEPAVSLRPSQTVGVIGCGKFAFTTIAYYLRRRFGNVIAICMDLDVHRAASMSRHYRIPAYSSNARDVIKLPQVTLIYIASNHASHAEYAIEALEADKNVFIEKPHVVSEDQLLRLAGAMSRSRGKVFLGFNRPGSRFGRLIRQYLERESGAGMYNWFVAGHAIDPNHWYFKPEEGGRVLGNLCHWTDFILRLVPHDTYPITICPTRVTKSDCDIAVTYTFNDGTVAVITFSAKGHTFEGVMERFSAHKGDALITMDDFKTMTIQVVDRKRRFWNLYREHGHKDNIYRAFEAVRDDLPYDREERLAYVWNTAWLFLKTREALERNEPITIQGFDRTLLSS
jgi:predicted dehydrogenase